MAIINVEGLGRVEIAGDVPTPSEAAAIRRAVAPSSSEFSGISNPSSRPEPAGFAERALDALADRGHNISGSLQRQGLSIIGRDQTLPETGVQIAGQGLGAVADVLGNVAISGFNALPDRAQDLLVGAGSSIGGVLGSIGDAFDQTAPGQALRLGDATLGRQAREFIKNNPRAEANVSALGNILTAINPAKAAGSVGAGVRAGADALESAAKRAITAIPSPERITSRQLRDQSSEFYSIAERAGGSVPASHVGGFLDEFEAGLKKGDLSDNAEAALLKVADPDGRFDDVSVFFSELRGAPLSLESFERIDKALGSSAFAAATPDAASRKIVEAQRGLRSFIEGIDESDIIGGKEGFEAFKKAREIWAKSVRVADVENIAKSAFATDSGNKVNRLKNGLLKFISDEDNLRGFSQKEIDLIKDTAESGIIREFSRNFTSRLPARIATSQNPASGALFTGGNIAANSLDESLALNGVEGITNAIGRGVFPSDATPAQTLGRGASALGRVAIQGGVGVPAAGLRTAFGRQLGQDNLATLGTVQQTQEEIERRRNQTQGTQ